MFTMELSTSPYSAFFYLLTIATFLLYVYFRVSKRRYFKLLSKIDGPPGLPLLGNALEFVGKPHVIMKAFYDKSMDYEFGRPLKVWIGPFRALVFLMDPRDVEVILSSHVHIDKSPEYRLFYPWLGDGLLISTGDKWRAHRKLIAPTFHLNVLKSFIELFNDNSQRIVQKMAKLGTKEFDCHNYMSEATVEILLETAMGVNKEAQDKDAFEYASAVMKMCDIIHMRHRQIWLRPDIIFNFTKYSQVQSGLLKIIHGLTDRVLQIKKLKYKSDESDIPNSQLGEENQEMERENRINHSDNSAQETRFGSPAEGLKDDLDVDDDIIIGAKKRKAFLDLLIESNAKNDIVLTDKEVREQVDTIMFEGHDTTAAGTSFFLCVVGLKKDVQDKIVNELDSIFAGTDRPVTFQDTVNMKYLERCIMETLRLWPPVPIIAREVREDVYLPSTGAVIPSNTTVIVTTYKLHRNPNTFKNPEEFNPDNFLPENSVNRHHYSYVPFSAGPRSCVGRKYAMLKMKILLSTILRNFRVHSDVKETDWKLQADIILKRADGFNIKLFPRQKKHML